MENGNIQSVRRCVNLYLCKPSQCCRCPSPASTSPPSSPLLLPLPAQAAGGQPPADICRHFHCRHTRPSDHALSTGDPNPSPLPCFLPSLLAPVSISMTSGSGAASCCPTTVTGKLPAHHHHPPLLPLPLEVCKTDNHGVGYFCLPLYWPPCCTARHRGQQRCRKPATAAHPAVSPHAGATITRTSLLLN